MPVYAATGRLGAGKTLWAVSQIQRYLRKGLKVAANVDIYLEKMFSPWNDQRDVPLIRIPDSPSRIDLDALGYGNTSTDESKNGLLVLDECGAILNARTAYRKEETKDLIDWFLHSRKLGWDIIFIVQHLSIIDKQIRESLLEYNALARRLDRVSLPLLSSVGIKITLPKYHFVTIRYGLDRNSPIADRDWFSGRDLYDVYNTRQILFKQANPDGSLKDVALDQAGISTSLSPWHLKGRHMPLKKLLLLYSRGALLMGLVIGIAVTWLAMKQLGYIKPPTELTGISDALPDVVGLMDDGKGHFTLVRAEGSLEKSYQVIFNKGTTYFRLSDGRLHYQPKQEKKK